MSVPESADSELDFNILPRASKNQNSRTAKLKKNKTKEKQNIRKTKRKKNKIQEKQNPGKNLQSKT
jgi:hypothetical protein